MRTRPLVLNVDDDVPGRYAVGRNLRQAGYAVQEAATGLDALKLVKELRPDLVLLDVRLPDIDGFEVCRRIRQESSDIASTPVIQLSASYLDTQSKVKGLQTGADAYLTEPVEPPILVATIESVLRIRRAEHELRVSAAQWRTTFDAIRDGVALLDCEGNLLRANACYREMSALDAGAIQNAIRNNLAAVRSGLSRVSRELKLGPKTLVLTLDPVIAEGAFDGAACVLSDVTEKKRFEAELRQTAKLESLGVLAGGIAHDFNNLLTGIIGTAGLLQDMFSEGTEESELIEQLLKSGESAADLTRQILAYAGGGRFMKAPVNLTIVALETRGLVRRFIPKGVDLTYQVDSNLPSIEGDSSQMRQIVMNLVINAGEAFGDSNRGAIRVATEQIWLEESFFQAGENRSPGRYVLLTVSDNGSGMDEKTQRRIFEPFFSTKFAGRGLGLSAVHGIVRNHGGYLRVESAPGAGTTFKIYLPVAAEQKSGGTAAETVEPRDVRGRILFVDDEPVIRNVAKTALEKRGYEVLLAEDGYGAVEVFGKAADAIDLVILDFAMPTMNGDEAMIRIRTLSESVPIVLSSGYGQAITADKFRDQPPAGFLNKPYSPEQLARMVEDTLANKNQ